MATEIVIPIIKLHELLRRALKVRRDRITDPLVNPIDLKLMISYGICPRPYRLNADGWVKIGIVTDHFVDADLGVWWEPETDRVRIERAVTADESATVPTRRRSGPTPSPRSRRSAAG